MFFLYEGNINMEAFINEKEKLTLFFEITSIDGYGIKSSLNEDGMFYLKNKKEIEFTKEQKNVLSKYYDFEYIYKITKEIKENLFKNSKNESYHNIEINPIKKYGVFRKEIDDDTCIMCTLVDKISSVTSINIMTRDKKDNTVTIKINELFGNKDELYKSLTNKPCIRYSDEI